MLTRRLAAHVDAIDFGRLPPEVVAKAKVCVLDAIGCGLGGVSHGAIAALLAAVRPAPAAEGGASVWGIGIRTSAPTAALLNGSMAHVVNADDAHKASMGHPGCVVVPAALAVGEMVAAPGAALLEAVVAGYECLLRIGIAVGVDSHRARGWYATGSLGPFGAATAAAKLLKLGPDGVAGAIGHAGAQASGLWAFTADGSLANLLYPGRAAEAGVLAALLVQHGLSGPTRVLEAEDGGFLRAMSDRSVPERLLEDPDHLAIMDVSLKPYPCSRTTHAPIDGALAIRARLADRPGWLGRVSRIVVHTYAVGKRQADIPEPATPWMATLSINYTVAVALLEGGVGEEHFAPRVVESARVRDLVRKVQVVVDDDLTAAFPGKWSCRVEVFGEDGLHETERVASALGDPLRPMSPAEVRAKFHGLTGDRLDREAGERICDFVEDLERRPDVAPLAAMLGAATGRGGTRARH